MPTGAIRLVARDRAKNDHVIQIVEMALTYITKEGLPLSWALITAVSVSASTCLARSLSMS